MICPVCLCLDDGGGSDCGDGDGGGDGGHGVHDAPMTGLYPSEGCWPDEVWCERRSCERSVPPGMHCGLDLVLCVDTWRGERSSSR